MALVLVAASLLVLVGVVGLSIDVGYVYLTSHQLQNAADAASMAGSRVVRDDPAEARDEAVKLAEANTAAREPVRLDPNASNDPDGDIVIGRYDREEGTFTPGYEAPNAVRVTARRNATSPGGRVALFFGGLFGVEGADIVRTATAKIGGGTGSGMIALGDGDCTVEAKGTTELTVNDGSIQVNSDSDCAVCTDGTPTIDTDDIFVGGDACFSSNTDFTGTVHPDSPPVDDPLKYLPSPYIGEPMQDDRVVVSEGEQVQLSPGYYPHGITVTGGELTLQPGIYTLGRPTSGGGSGGQYPAGLNISGGTVIGEGVMLYIDDGAVDIGANVNVTLSPPNPEGYSYVDVDTYEHITIFQARHNDYNARIAGGPGLDLSGTLYFPENHLNLVGSGAGQFGNQIISNSIELSGTGEIEINYNGAFPAAGNIIFLVQ